MRTALLAFLICLGAGLLLAWYCALSNADFIYMCVGAGMLQSGRILASPYFPAAYPLLIWLGVKCGLSALGSGMLLSAIGSALSAACVSYLSRRWGLPSAPALLAGLCAAALPSVFQTTFNPSLDALYTGLCLLLFSIAFNAALAAREKLHEGGAFAVVAIGAGIVTVLLCGLRYHALLPVGAVIVLLFCFQRPARTLGMAVLFAAVLATGANFWLLHQATGDFQTAGALQLATGAQYRAAAAEGQSADEAGTRIFENYPAFLETAAMPGWAVLWEGVKQNWPQFLLRKPVLAGYALWLLGLAVRRRQTPGALWLALFIPFYTLPIAAAYFTERASALPELCGILLGCGGAATLFFSPAQKPARGRQPRATQSGGLDPALAGGLLSLIFIAALCYDARREIALWQSWRDERSAILTADRAALAAAHGNRLSVYGAFATTGWSEGEAGLLAGKNPYNLPSPSWTRFWLEDPSVARQLGGLLTRYSFEKVLSGDTPVRVIVLRPDKLSPQGALLRNMLASNAHWRESGNAGGAVLWSWRD